MPKSIIYNHPETGIAAIVHPAYGDLARDPGDSDADLLARCLKRVPAGTPYAIIEDSEIPQDRTFRDAWEWVD
jgi:hypothetical protein